MTSDAAILREILARECETVNHYEELAASAESDSVRALVLHLASEEKEHIAECARLLTHLDAEYAEMMKKPLSHALGGHSPEGDDAQQAQTQSQTTASEAEDQPPLTFTVGSLIDRDHR